MRYEEYLEVGQLSNLLIQCHPVRGEIDKALWCLKRDFTVKTLLDKTSILVSQGVEIDNLVCTVWMNITPLKLNSSCG